MAKDFSSFAGTQMSSLDCGMVGGNDSSEAGCGNTTQTTPKFTADAEIFRRPSGNGRTQIVQIVSSKTFMLSGCQFVVIATT